MTDQEQAAPTVAEVLGRTARGLRGDLKVELVARAAKSAGLNWGTGRIADLEAGRVSPTLPTLFALCWAFSDLLDHPVALAELFAGDGRVTLTPGATVELADLRAALGGQPIGSEPLGPIMTPSAVNAMNSLRIGLADVRADIRKLAADPDRRPRMLHPRAQDVKDSMLEADYRVAHSLGIDFDRGAEEMEALWGRSFTEERDHRGGPDANPQKRGRISRELKVELQEAINRGDD